MMKKTREQWKEVIEDQKASGLSIEKYCQQSHICVSSFYKYKSLIIKEESSFLPVVVDKDDEMIDCEIDHHHISCSKQHVRVILESLL